MLPTVHTKKHCTIGLRIPNKSSIEQAVRHEVLYEILVKTKL